MSDVLRSLALTVAMLLAVAGVRPQLEPFRRGLPEPLFWQLKVTAARHDVLVLGDSRALQGLAPDALRYTWSPSLRALNFAFHSVNYDRRYLEAGRRKLDTRRCPVAILGLTTRSLSQIPDSGNGFLGSRDRARGASINRLWYRFEPLAWDRLLWTGLLPSGAWEVQEHRGDGFVYADRQPFSLERELRWYRSALGPAEEAPTLIDDVVTTIRHWRSDGIEVVAVRMPVAAEIADIEAERSSLDWTRVRRRIEGAGGRWLQVADGAPFQTYDGSHLRGDEALRFSEALGTALSASIRCLAARTAD